MVTGFFALRVKNLVTFYFLVTEIFALGVENLGKFFLVTRFFALGVKSLQVVIYFILSVCASVIMG